MRACIATILPSEQEGLPRSVMESLSLEVPVIGSDIRGTHGLLQDGCGLLFDLGDTTALSDAMAWFADHKVEAAAMGQRGRTQMVDVYAQRHIVALHYSLYLEALK
jgi:glycosyltransferase involved in cell wall biosynthesis